jgi:hypothetical protein
VVSGPASVSLRTTLSAPHPARIGSGLRSGRLVVAVLGFVRRRPLTCYFALVFLLTGLALLVIGLPKLQSTASRSMLPLVMFPVMVIGVGLTGIALAAATGGRKGLQELHAQHAPTGDPHWLAAQVRRAARPGAAATQRPGFPWPGHSRRWPTGLGRLIRLETWRTGTPPDRHYKENCHASHPRFP